MLVPGSTREFECERYKARHHKHQVWIRYPETPLLDPEQPIEESELEVFLLGWGPLFLDADMALYGQFTTEVNPPKGLGSSFYTNPVYDELMKDSRKEQDATNNVSMPTSVDIARAKLENNSLRK